MAFLIQLCIKFQEGKSLFYNNQTKLLKTLKQTMSNQLNPIPTQSSTQEACQTKISKRQIKRNKIIESQHQLANQDNRCNYKMENILNDSANKEETLRDERSVSKETTSTTLGGSRISNRDSDEKSLENINLQLRNTASERVQLDENKKKKGKGKAKKPKQDNSNSHHALAIEDSSNNSCLIDKQKTIEGQDYLHTIQDRDKNPIYPTIEKELSLAQKNRKRFEEKFSSIRIKTVLAQQKIADNENFKFSYRNQRVLPEIRPLFKSQLKEMAQILCIQINFDSQSRDRKVRQKYRDTTQPHRVKQLCRRISHLMRYGVDVILLQQVYSKEVRRQLLKTIKEFNKEGNVIYSYPQNLEFKDEFLTTMILTKHNANFGQLSFKIKDPETKKFIPFPEQAFCEFNFTINGKEETVCFLSCHLKSNRGFDYSKAFSIIRKNQIEYLKDFGKLRKYDRFICVGDTNINDSKFFKSQNAFLGKNFCDAVNYGLSQVKGSFLFIHENGSVTNERIDRVLVDLKSADTTLVQIKYIDLLLRSCKDQNLDRIETLVKRRGNFQQITLTDHSILEVRIRFTNQ